MTKTIERKLTRGHSDISISFDEGCNPKMIEEAIEFYLDYIMIQKRALLLKGKKNQGIDEIKKLVLAYKNHAFEININKKKTGIFSPKTVFYGEIIEKGPDGINKINFYEEYNPNKR